MAKDKRLKTFQDRLTNANSLWKRAFQGAVEGKIDKEKLISAIELCNTAEKAYSSFLEVNSQRFKEGLSEKQIKEVCEIFLYCRKNPEDQGARIYFDEVFEAYKNLILT